MTRIALVTIALGIAGMVAAFSAAPQEAVAGKACVRTKFETKLVADACQKGGQEEAKKVMKAWLKAAKKQEAKLDCKSCHTKLAPKYELTKDGLEKFQKLGGR